MMTLSSKRRTQILQAVIPAYLVLCVIFGGSSIVGPLANGFLQLLAIPLLYVALTVRMSTPLTASGRQMTLFVLLVLLLFAIQLIPLPASLWTRLPGRETFVEGYRLLGIPLPSASISLMPNRTLAALLWLLPSFAVLFGMLRWGAFNTRTLILSLGAVACTSVLLGAVQLAGGDQSPAYLYEQNSTGVATGFFTNPNHFGTLMLMAIPMLAALLADEFDRRGNRKHASATVVVVIAMILLLLVGIVITRSLAAIGLAIPVAAASIFIIHWRKRRMPIWIAPAVGAVVLAVLATIAVQPSDNDLTSSGARTDQLSRYTKYVTTFRAIGEFMPVGTGMGTTPFVYHLYENPATIIRTHASHTHSDPLETVLDGGIAGLILIGLFLIGWAWRAMIIWRAPEADGFARAATIASAAAMAHSLVDYPLRTAAVGAVLMAMLALMAGARERSAASRQHKHGAVRHLAV